MKPRVVFLGKQKPSVHLAWMWLQAWFNCEWVNRHDAIEPCDILVSFLYAHRIPADVLARAQIAINFHPAPLPEYRGLWGASRAILAGATTFGVTAHAMTPDIDAGPIIASRSVHVFADDTAASLDARAQEKLLELFRDTMSWFAAGTVLMFKPQPPAPPPPTRAELEASKRVLAIDPPGVVDRKARAWWFPPYQGAQVSVAGQWYTIAPHCVAGGAS